MIVFCELLRLEQLIQHCQYYVRQGYLKIRFLYALFLQEDKDFDEVMDEESGDEAEGVEADTTMTLQGGVSKD